MCDVCSNEEATLYCSADEAVLCRGCDSPTTRPTGWLANTTASPSSPFLPPTPNLYVTYVRRRTFLFCQEERAILCRDCGLPIHCANRHTGKHTRFLLTGVRLSLSSPAPEAAQPTTCSDKENGGEIPTINGSTISEYLIKTIPGWHVEDLLQNSIDVASDVNGLSKQESMEFEFEDLVSIVIDGELSVQKLLGFSM